MEHNIADLDDEQLAATAYVWRKRAAAGDRQAHLVWARMEKELAIRLGPSPSHNMPLDDINPIQSKWWKFWA